MGSKNLKRAVVIVLVLSMILTGAIAVAGSGI